MATDVMINASGLSKRFGSVRALDNVSFEVQRGEVVGFLGPNGAGKSTTMRILTCFISPTNGTARVNGHDVFERPLEVRRALGYLPQRAPLYHDMTVWEYLRFAAEIRGLDEPSFKKRLKKVVEVCGLAQTLGKDIATLSHGFRQRVGLGQALIHDPQILILDEPTSDLDPNEKAEVLRYIKEIGKDRTILLSTHNLAEVEDACARAIIVSKGRVVADGALGDIRSKTGRMRYVVTIDERRGEAGNPAPTAAQIQEALEKIDRATGVRELPTDGRAYRGASASQREHKLEVTGPQDVDLRAEIFRLAVAKGWTLLELRRDAQSLDAVFRDLTRGDERLDRGLLEEDEEEDEDEDEDARDEEEDEDEGEDEDEDENEDEDEDERARDEGDDEEDEEDDDDEEGDSERKKG